MTKFIHPSAEMQSVLNELMTADDCLYCYPEPIGRMHQNECPITKVFVEIRALIHEREAEQKTKEALYQDCKRWELKALALESECDDLRTDWKSMVTALEKIREEGDLAEYDYRTDIAEKCLESLNTISQ